MTIQVVVVKKTRKEKVCCMCGKTIPIGSECISAFGYDYDNDRINEKVHCKKECYEEWFGNIDGIEPKDFPQLVMSD